MANAGVSKGRISDRTKSSRTRLSITLPYWAPASRITTAPSPDPFCSALLMSSCGHTHTFQDSILYCHCNQCIGFSLVRSAHPLTGSKSPLLQINPHTLVPFRRNIQGWKIQELTFCWGTTNSSKHSHTLTNIYKWYVCAKYRLKYKDAVSPICGGAVRADVNCSWPLQDSCCYSPNLCICTDTTFSQLIPIQSTKL